MSTKRGAAQEKRKLAKSLAEDTSYNHTSSPDGKIESVVLMHSRMGIRIELNLHRSELALWISPQAGKSLDCSDRNFSCRDDHTSVFDRIWFPELRGKAFVRCDYDPFHCVLHFKGQALHLATLIDQPVVLLWAEEEEVVDLKADKQDALLRRAPRVFAVRHPDRGKVLDFCAALGKGKGEFQHQKEIDAGRSTYARVVLPAGQVMVVGGELARERVVATVTRLAGRSVKELLAASEKKIAQQLLPGTLVLKDAPEMQKLYDMNKRHLLSVQDASGALRAALKYVYYLIWGTDGSVTATSMAQTGWPDYLRRWMEFMLANPTSQESPPQGRFYGQLVNPKITKREEFGSVCAVWPAFMYWGLTGDKRFVTGKHLELLEDVVDWMDRYCFDPKMGAIGTFYISVSEDPFYGSNDFGWDAAVGSFMNRNCYAPRYDGHLILREYGFGMNLNQYNMYLMLWSVTEGAKAARYLRKARTIEKSLLRLLEQNAVAYCLLDEKGMTLIPRGSRWAGDDDELETGRFAVQNQSPAFFMPEFATLYLNRMKRFRPLTPEGLRNQYACVVYGKLQGLDTEFVDEAGIIRSLEISLPYHVKPSRYIPMPYTMVEFIGAEDGSFHDIRPQAFSAGPFQAAITNLAIRTMPFGIALRGTNYIRELNGFEYLKSRIDVRYRGAGKIGEVKLNGKPLRHTLQLPDERLKAGANRVEVVLRQGGAEGPTLVYSTVRLHDVAESMEGIQYSVTGYCQNVLVFRDVVEAVVVRDSKGKAVRVKEQREGRHRFVEFWGKGRYSVEVQGPVM